jgi:hypothetical protein
MQEPYPTVCRNKYIPLHEIYSPLFSQVTPFKKLIQKLLHAESEKDTYYMLQMSNRDQ